MLFTAVTSLAVGFAATLASAAPPNAAHAASDISDSCDTAISDKKCCFALTAKQDLGNGKVQDWGYVKESKTGRIFVGFDINAYPQGYFCLYGKPTDEGTYGLADGMDNRCDFLGNSFFDCSNLPSFQTFFGTTKTKLSDGSEIVILTRKSLEPLGICPQDAKQSLFKIVYGDDVSFKGCHRIHLALEPHTPDTCPK
ncbi:hypothetical protein CGCF415_v003590 [Colletotrichum fructicola]|uniref:Secreted protein n=1 Tax=Colletotrichum fructicola (strain Nara gc5) TaxID=1213859 RepID=L2FR12_COLFN|nr:uncharacterized protein CGMCC3_g4237 [Colletotrichum fructicola]KAF4487528.1 hypothetical protein CGGC5_v006490 [Colletotrichum fructicola Nara gc5]KAE9579585.1 hypothetical protein CGMCC3_g4237 [Colletotrichum fructicola]KAF4429232.1 hypothetical protein CFRS1_v007089 [Colletotrichum fructicola]KAF4891305.1 hypothetical protein CGCFRS4_v008203 [Colletotrichum fructicola]KAF4912515.1 hypothetical protein CGCF415_v003590 [Colletotrichum fructicola]